MMYRNICLNSRETVPLSEPPFFFLHDLKLSLKVLHMYLYTYIVLGSGDIEFVLEKLRAGPSLNNR